jgi:lysozyme
VEFNGPEAAAMIGTAEDLVVARLLAEEGFRATKYLDTKGHWTIGYGFNVDAGISQFAALALLTAQVDERYQELRAYPWFVLLDPVRQSVCLDIAFNDGERGLLGYVNMIAALTAHDWQGAHDELLNSLAARAFPTRYEPLARLFLTGDA